MHRIVRPGVLCAALMGLIALNSGSAEAKPPFAKKEGVNCVYCHVVPGGDRNFRGMYYATNEHSFANFDNEFEAKSAGVKPDASGADAKPTVEGYPGNVKVAPALNFTLRNIDGKPVNLGRYQGKVVLMVNVASKCGYTPQYEKLQKLYAKYKDKGLVILGFPANEFGAQEPGTNKEIKEFCSSKYSVTFPMFSKIVVKGEEIHPLYKFLTSEETDKKFAGTIEWNFTKFLVNRKGEVIARYKSPVDPMKEEVIKAVEKALEEKAPEKSARR